MCPCVLQEKNISLSTFNYAQVYTIFQKKYALPLSFFGNKTSSVSYISPCSATPTQRFTFVLYISLPCCVALILWNLSSIYIDLWKSVNSRLEMNRFHFQKVEGMLPVIRGNTRWFSIPRFHHHCVLTSLPLTDLSFTCSSFHALTCFPKV